MALFRGIQEYIALNANNITLVFDSGNIVNISGNIFLYPPQGHPILYNYRPISLLPSFSKVFEKIIFNQLYEYFDSHKYFYSSQYGFRKYHSTEHAALESIDKIITDMDKGYIPINIYLDMSKAFDILDHIILIDKLKYYGITGTALDLFISYLSNRKQYVDFKGIKSNTLDIKTSVPQGSILGPLLFIIFINDFSKSSNLFDFIIYADDTSLSSTLNAFDTDTDNINRELEKINIWLNTNKLSLNVNKSKFMIFHCLQRKINIPVLRNNDTDIECVENFDLLGITLNQHMNWKTHISKLSNKISRTIGILNRLKYILPLHVKLIIYNSLILSHLYNGILAWGYEHEKITKLQN